MQVRVNEKRAVLPEKNEKNRQRNFFLTFVVGNSAELALLSLRVFAGVNPGLQQHIPVGFAQSLPDRITGMQ
ncbi:hypothetical protein [Haliea sp. E17]|uniref:hypothetical protein n=1 Tax=Haliea sp. E17 TaxID=3401576 RepID=UPI003AAA56F8